MMGDMTAASPDASAPGEAAASSATRAASAGATASGAELADLLRRSSRGDELAFAALYDATARRLFGLVLRVVRDHAMSEEVTQEVYLDVWRHCSRFDPERGSAMSWLMTIAHRTAVDRVRASEASRRRDDVHATTNQEVEFDTTAESAQASLEAQRLGRLLRPKADGRTARFYAVVSRDTVDADFAQNRQRFLAEQGYAYRIIDSDDLDRLDV